MPLRTPQFWGRPHHILGTILSPFSTLYKMGSTLHNARQPAPYTPTIPVICVGNITVGGSGKTPIVLSLLSLLKTEGLANNPCILMRGYGGRLDLHKVDESDTVEDVGDEALLLRGHTPVFIAKDRAAGCRMAEAAGHDLVLMDDGFQNKSIVKTLSLLVFDGRYGLGNQKHLPAGPLRESLTNGLSRADAVVINGADTYGLEKLINQSLPTFHTHIKMDFIPKKNTLYVAFCGIGQPDKFFRMLEKENIPILETCAYSDHHFFTKNEISSLLDRIKKDKGRLLTTEKDFVRLKNFPEILDKTDVVPIKIIWEKETAFVNFLKQKLGR